MKRLLTLTRWRLVAGLILLTLFALASRSLYADEVAGAGAMSLLPPLDRGVARRLEQAEHLVAQERWSEAVVAIGALLESEDVDRIVADNDTQNTNTKANTGGVHAAVYRTTLRDRVVSLLVSLPEAARQLYRDQYAPLAQRLLATTPPDDVAALATIADRYPLTPAALEAAAREAVARFARGEVVAVALCLQRLFRDTASDAAAREQFEPTLSLLAATASLAIGHTRDTDTILEELFRREVSTTVRLPDGTLWTADRRDELRERLTASLAAEATPQLAAWQATRDWPQTGGTPWQIAPTVATPPILDPEWSLPTLTSRVWRREVELFAQRLATRTPSRRVILPAAEPLVVGNVLLMRGFDETLGVDLSTGKRLWRATEPDTFTVPTGTNRMFAPLRVPREQLFSQRRPLVVAEMFWANRLYHAFTSGNGVFYEIESQPFLLSLLLAPHRGLLGTRRDATTAIGNTLTARRIDTGAIVWEHGKRVALAMQARETAANAARHNADDAEDGDDNTHDKTIDTQSVEKTMDASTQFLSEQSFLGPPLVLEDRLAVLCESGGTIRLATLDAATGRLLRKQPLASTTLNGYPVRFQVASTPVHRSGVLVCATGAGVVAAVDAVTGRPLWTHVYASESQGTSDGASNEGASREAFTPSAESDDGLFTSRAWLRPATILTSRLAIVAPADAPTLLALDLATGDVVWRHDHLDRRTLLGIAAVTDDELFVLTPDALVGVSLHDGEWTSGTGSLRPDVVSGLPTLTLPALPVGFGIADEGHYWVPLADGRIIGYDLAAKTESGTWTMASSPFRDREALGATAFGSTELLGNLVAVHGRIVSASPLATTLFTQQATLESSLASPTRNSASPRDALTARARLARQRGDITETLQLLQKSAADFEVVTPRHQILLKETLVEGITRDVHRYATEVFPSLELLTEPRDVIEVLLAFLEAMDAQPTSDPQRARDIARDIDTAVARLAELAQSEDFLVASGPDLRSRLSLLIAARANTFASTAAQNRLASENIDHALASGIGPLDWLSGTVRVVSTPLDIALRERDFASGAAGATQIVVPSVGRISPVCRELQFVLAFIGDGEPRLLGHDAWGRTAWELPLDDVAADILTQTVRPGGTVGEWTESPFWVTSCGSLAVVALGRTLLGLDLGLDRSLDHRDADATPTILWTRRLDEPIFIARCPMAIPLEQLGAILDRRENHGGSEEWLRPRAGPLAGDDTPCLLTPERLVLWSREASRLTALDPQTGTTLWERRCDTPTLTLIGDDTSLFTVELDRGGIVRSFDPLSGRLLGTGQIPLTPQSPDGTQRRVIASAGRHILTLTHKTARRRTTTAEFGMVPLDALVPLDAMVSPSPESEIAELPYRAVRSGVPLGSVFRFLRDGTSVAIFAPSGEVHLVDIPRGEATVFPPVMASIANPHATARDDAGSGDEKSGEDSNEDVVQNASTRFQLFDLDLLTLGRRGADEARLVFLLERRAVTPPADASRRLPPRDQRIRPVNWGRLSLYTRGGTPLWDRETIVQNTFELLDLPPAFPLLVFAAVVIETEPRARETTRVRLAITAIEKETGRVCLNEVVDTDGVIGRFAFSGDPTTHTLRLTTATRVIDFVFDP